MNDTIVTVKHKRGWFSLTEINEKLLQNYPGAVLVLNVEKDGTLLDAYVGTQDGEPHFGVTRLSGVGK